MPNPPDLKPQLDAQAKQNRSVSAARHVRPPVSAASLIRSRTSQNEVPAPFAEFPLQLYNCVPLL